MLQLHLPKRASIKEEMRAYSNDLRRAVIEAYERQDYSQHQLAEVFGVSPATVRNWIRRKREYGSPDAFPHAGGGRAKLNAAIHARVREWGRGENSLVLRELCQQVKREFRTHVSRSTMCRLLGALRLSRKKERSMPVNRIPHGSSEPGRSIGQ